MKDSKISNTPKDDIISDNKSDNKPNNKITLIIIIAGVILIAGAIVFIVFLNRTRPLQTNAPNNRQIRVTTSPSPILTSPSAVTTTPNTDTTTATVTTTPATTAPPVTTTPFAATTTTGNPIVYVPSPVRSDELKALITQRTETPRGVEYFDNSMIIGDSITTGFRIWRQHILLDGEPLNNTVIFASGSYGIFNSLREVTADSIHPEYDGKQMRPEDAVALSGVERVFISMGLNDVYLSLDVFIENYRKLLNRISEKNPGVQIIILPVPPYMHTAQPTPDRNARIAEYNNALILLAHETGVAFIDSTAPLRDENDGLKPEFCGDAPPAGQGCHWVPNAYIEVIKYIVEHPAY